MEKTSSPHNEYLEVSLKKGRLMLSTHNAIYSFSDKYDNFGEAFQQMDLSRINEVLLLGFGLGSIPFILEKKCNKRFSYTGIEIDEEVTYLASKYILPQLKSEINLITTDAINFLTVDANKYDLIAMDVFESDYIPEQFETKEFLQTLKNKINKEGIIMYNRLAYTDEDVDKSVAFYHDIFNEVFPDATYLTIKGNLMLINREDVLK